MATETPETIDRSALPPAGTWTFDKNHTRLEFVARHMLSKVRGRFTEFDGTVTIGERPEDSHVEVEMQTASITDRHGYAGRPPAERRLPGGRGVPDDDLPEHGAATDR